MWVSVVGRCSSQPLFLPFRSRHVYTLIDYQGGRDWREGEAWLLALDPEPLKADGDSPLIGLRARGR